MQKTDNMNYHGVGCKCPQCEAEWDQLIQLNNYLDEHGWTAEAVRVALHKPMDAQERAIAEDLNHKLVARALRLEGTCTGEHGIGLGKKDFLVQETGDGAVAMMRTLKRALDPKNILNPGKIFSL